MRLIWLVALAFASLVGESAAMVEESCTTTGSNCFHKSAGNFSEDVLVNELVAWITENGGVVDHRQMVRKADDHPEQNNVYATAFIPKGTVLLSVPWDMILFPKDDPEKNSLCDTVQALRQELEAYSQGKSPFFAMYMRYLVSKLSPMAITPGAWSQAGQDLLHAVLGDKLPPHRDVSDNNLNFEWWRKRCGGHDDGADSVRDALLLVQGYKSPGLRGLSDDDDDDDDDVEKNPRFAMIPFYDVYSKRSGGWLNTNLEEAVVNDEFVMTASRDIEAGEPIHTPVTQSTDIHFLESGRVEKLPRRHSFTFLDNNAGSNNQQVDIEFVLDEAEDEDGNQVHAVTWVNDIYGGNRACNFLEVELDRLAHVHDFLTPDHAYLEAVPPHERNAIFEYTSALIDALSAAIEARYDPMPVTEWTLLDYEVAGVNLGTYNLIGEEEEEADATSTEPYQLFQDFDMSHLISGDEGWKDIIEYRRTLDRPSLSFYVDKVARKRWLPSKGITQAKQYVLKYVSELSDTGDEHDETRALFEQIPNMTDYAAKPSHHSEGSGVWLVSYDKETNVTSFSSTARQLEQGKDFDKWKIATALAHNLHMQARDGESTSLKRVKPGVVVEERMVEVDHFHRAPVEFCVFVIWGKVWVAQMNLIDGEERYLGHWMYRNGTLARGDVSKDLEDYIEFSRVVEIAESLGANKDMFRVDIFVGLPAGSPALRADASREERLEAVEYGVNECEIYPTTNFRSWQQLAQDGARLWVAGYKKGNYVTVPNTEVPEEFLETGSLSEL
jgi:hypothetical protein